MYPKGRRPLGLKEKARRRPKVDAKKKDIATVTVRNTTLSYRFIIAKHFSEAADTTVNTSSLIA